MRGRYSIASLMVALLLVFGLSISGITGVRAQDDATPEVDDEGPRPAHIHEGSCDELGAVVAPLTDLAAAEGESVGQTDDTDSAPQYSFTNVPLPLDAIVAADHAINVHESAENIDVYLACGEIGGVIDFNGSLVIGLRELNGSGYTGIAVLTASTIDPATTDVSVFIAADLAEGVFDDDMLGDDDADTGTGGDLGTPAAGDDDLDDSLGTPVMGDDDRDDTDDAGDDLLDDGTPEVDA